MTYNTLTFSGCTPAPMISYLKALGILRLFSCDSNHVSGKAADPRARGWWKNECFQFSTALDQDSLFHFFLYDYVPSPIIAPWNGRAGFLEGDEGPGSSRTGAELVNLLQQSESSRFEAMRKTIKSLRGNDAISNYDRLRAKEKSLSKEIRRLRGEEKTKTEQKLRLVKKQAKEAKSRLLPTLRTTTDVGHLVYIDACYVLSADEAAAPLLGSGGNDGSRDFGVNFSERLKDLFDFDDGAPKMGAAEQLEMALFGTQQRLKETGSMGQFSPGQGGANATTGYHEKKPPLNVWDVVLAMEGTIVFAGALTRRWGATGGSRGAFPFTFEPASGGAGNLSTVDPNRPRGEIWAPLWYKPATFSEIRATFAEGRLTIGRRTARTGLDAARSIARIGQSRGIGSFERYSFIQPDAQTPYQATPLGRFNAPDRPRRDLIEELEAGNWLERARRLAGSDSAPAHARSTMRRLEDALFQMTDAGRTGEGTRNALMALGSFVTWSATSPKSHEKLTPPPLLSSQWIVDADDRTAEFRTAVALAGIGLPASRNTSIEPLRTDSAAVGDGTWHEPEESKTLPMTAHFAPINEDMFFDGRSLRRNRQWSKTAIDPCVVWGTGSLVSNLTAVLERRLVEAAIRGLDHKPLDGAAHAGLDDIATFLSGDFDDARCAALLAGLVWTKPIELKTKRSSFPLPFAYAVLKPVFTPDRALRRIGLIPEAANIPVPPGLITRLRSAGAGIDGKATDNAVRIALARCRGSGVVSAFDSSQAGIRAGARESSRMGAGVQADRLAAALLVPVSDDGLRTLVDRAYPGAIPNDKKQPVEV